MSSNSHPNEKVSAFIADSLEKISGIKMIKSESKEAVVFDEKEISWIYTFQKEDSGVRAVLTISDPLYFCDVSFLKYQKPQFQLKSYLKNVANNNDIEDLFENFIDEKIDQEEYSLAYLNIFKNSLDTLDVQKIMNGDMWPDVPSEEE